MRDFNWWIRAEVLSPSTSTFHPGIDCKCDVTSSPNIVLIHHQDLAMAVIAVKASTGRHRNELTSKYSE
jgi:hypothetical protein